MTPDRIKYGEKIDRPGLYYMPMAWHHADCCIEPSVTSTVLRTIYLKTARNYWSTSIYNPDRVEDDPEAEEARHFRVGRAAHTLLLEPYNFSLWFKTRPPIYTSWRTKEAIKWRGEQIMAGITVLTAEEMLVVQSVVAAMKSHNLSRDGVLDGIIECSIVYRDDKTGIWVKSRPDALPMSENTVSDLKVSAEVSPRAVNRAVRKFGYDQQLALAGTAIFRVLGREIEQFLLVSVQADRSGDVLISPIGDAMIVRAMRRNRGALDTFAECLKAGYWPSYDAHDGEFITLSPGEEEQQLADIAAGLLPKEY